MPTQLDAAGRRLLTYLVQRMPEIETRNPRTFVTYKQAHDALGLRLRGGSYGTSLLAQGMDNLAAWTSQAGMPQITCLIVTQKTGQPASGFFQLVGYSGPDSTGRWRKEVEATKAHDWNRYIDPLTLTRLEQERRQQVAVWKLAIYHEPSRVDLAFSTMVERKVIAVGWSNIGDLTVLNPANAGAITSAIGRVHPDLGNAHFGGASLWRLQHEVRPGDLVIATSGGRRRGVFEVTGEYFFAEDGVLSYQHQRPAALTGIDADELWSAVDRRVAVGENSQWTLALCRAGDTANELVHTEGERYDIRTTAYERDPSAREACLRFHGRACYVCGFDFDAVYGADLAKGYIHVHHRVNIALRGGHHVVNPREDLVPLCPNCHAMVHKESPAMLPEELKKRLEKWRSRG